MECDNDTVLAPMVTLRNVVAGSLIAAAVAVAPAAAQQPPGGEHAALAQGWGLLANGDAVSASAIAAGVLGQNPRSAAALVLAVDAEIARAGGAAGLNIYERWLGIRPLDDAYVLRRVARAMLLEHAADGEAMGVRLEALRALTADGEPVPAAVLQQSAASGSLGETRVLATLGDERAVRALITQLEAASGGKSHLIASLADSASPLAVPALTDLLTDQNDINRMAAADALGRLGAKGSIPPLRALLSDPVFMVRLAAARALHRMGDQSGVPFLQELARSEHSAVRIGAIEAFADEASPWWQAIARDLATDPDPSVRLGVARLMAPYDQRLALSVLQRLLADENAAVRESAARTLARNVATDFAVLRGLLRNPDPAVRVQAADRLLALTR